MGKRIKIVGLFALCGFLLGVATNLVYFRVFPVLAQLFPQIMGTTWLLWGIIGAAISATGCLLYAYMPQD